MCDSPTPTRHIFGAKPLRAYLPAILFTVLTNAAAQILLKSALRLHGPIDLGAHGALGTGWALARNPWLILGLTTFVVSMGSHLYVLSRVELSYAYPFLSLAYVVVAVFAWMVFGENLNVIRWAGIALICAGTVLISYS